MWRRTKQLIRKEVLQTLRDPRMRVTLFLPPLVQLIIFGYAVNLDVEHSRIAWMDQDRTPQSRELGTAFGSSRYFDIVSTPEREDDIRRLLDHGEVQAVIRVLPGFGRDTLRGETAAVQILVEGTNSNTASLVSNYANQVVAAFAQQTQAAQQRQRLLLRGGESAANVSLPTLRARSRVWFNPDLRSRNYFVPGVIVNILMIVTLMLTSLGIVREKEIGTMEQLMVTPVRPVELMLGKTVPFAVVGILNMVVITTAAVLVFHIPFRGSALFMLGCALPYLLSTLGAGLFISTISHTQQQAMMASFFFTMPAFMLSGFAFPIRNMPVAVQYITYINPLRYFMEVVRGIFLKGVGIEVLWPQLVILTVYGVAILGLSAWRFQKRLD